MININCIFTYDLSTEQEASTLTSLGDHCKSSTDSLCPLNERKLTTQLLSLGFHVWILPWQSPLAKTPKETNQGLWFN